MAITIAGRKASDKKALADAVKSIPRLVEIETPTGMVPYFAGTLDRIPHGVTYFAKEGKLTASFTNMAGTVVCAV